MEKNDLRGVGGWLLVYVIGSIPPMMVYAMGLSGFFFDYPFLLMLGLFGVFATPLLLLVLKHPEAPRWNVVVMWAMAVLMTLRALGVVLMPAPGEGPMTGSELLGVVGILTAIVGFAWAWAFGWTRYFRNSVRVRNTFS